MGKIFMALTAGGALVAVKCRAVNWSTKLRTSFYNVIGLYTADLFGMYKYNYYIYIHTWNVSQFNCKG
jgi:hypothetical protein